MPRTIWRAFVVMAIGLLPVQILAAGPEGAVIGNGHAVIKRQPQLLRAQLTITVEGKDINDAAAKLKEAKTSAAKKLADLGATEGSVEFGSVQAGANESAQQQYMQRMMAMARGRGPKPPEKPKTVTLSTTVKAEWPLKETSADDLVVAGYTLQEKIKNSGITPKENKQLTPEEQEAQEEAQAMQAANGAAGAAPGEPTFFYVAKISEADQTAALTEAFQKAKSDAAKLAKAAGGDLGALAHLTSAITSAPQENDENNAYARFMMRQMMGDTAQPAQAAIGEATAAQAGPVEMQVSVTASFNLK